MTKYVPRGQLWPHFVVRAHMLPGDLPNTGIPWV